MRARELGAGCFDKVRRNVRSNLALTMVRFGKETLNFRQFGFEKMSLGRFVAPPCIGNETRVRL